MSDDSDLAVKASFPVRALRLGLRLLVGLVPLLLLLLLTELGFRMAGVGTPEVKPPWESGRQQVVRAAPDGRESGYAERILAGAPVSVNELGFRDWLYREEKDEGTIRVIGLGDSYTYGQGVEADAVWLRRLGERLRGRLPRGRTLQTLNFGKQGTNTSEQVEILTEKAFRFRPDVVILGFTLYNDAETRKEYQAAGRERVKRKASLVHRLVGWLRQNSYAANHVLTVTRRGRNRAAMREHIESQYADDAPGWRECRKSLAAIAKACREEDVPLVVFTFPVHHDDVGLNLWGEYDLVDAHEKVRSALSAFPEVAFVELVEGMKDLEGKRIWVLGDGHPNDLYHAKVAEILEPPVTRALGLGSE